MNEKFKIKLLLALLVSAVILSTVSNGIFVSNKFYSANLARSTSGLYAVNVTVTYNGVTEKIMFADHSSDLADGNWIELSGGTAVKIPKITLSYQGVQSATYERESRTVKVELTFNQKQITYPLTIHHVYFDGEEVTATFHGSSQLAEKKVNISLIKTSPLEARDILNEAFKGNIQPLRSLLSRESTRVWEVTCTLDADGDFVKTFKAPDPGDYILLVLNETENSNSYELRIYSATVVEVLDYSIEVSAPSSVTRGDRVRVNINLVDAPQSETGYRYGALMIHEDAYNVLLELSTDGTVPGTTLTANGASLLTGTAERTFLIAGVGLSNINKDVIYEKIASAVSSKKVLMSFMDVTSSTSATIYLMTEGMTTGRYILLVGVWEIQTGKRVVALYQGSLRLKAPYVPSPTPSPRPTLTPEEVEAMSAEEAAEKLEALPAEQAANILEQVSTEKATDILEIMSTEKAADIVEELTAEKATNITMMVKPEKAADILEEVAIERAKDIFETAVSANLTGKAANVTLAMNRTVTASVIIEVNASLAAPLIETMIDINVTGTAEIIEDAAKTNIEKTAPILEKMETESLAVLLIEIARLPSSPETAAALLEAMSLEKTVEIVRFMIEYGAYEELGEIFHYLSTERLNDIFGALTLDERVKLLPYLTSETVAKISPQLLPFPDLTPFSIEIIPLEPVAEETCTVKVTVKNFGMFDAGRFDATLYVDNLLIQTLPVEALAVNGTATLSFNWTPAEPATYTLKVIVDPENLVDELNETNNEISISVSVKPKPLPDLTVEFVDLPEEFVAGTEYEVKALVKNVGEADTEGFNVELKANEASLGKVPVEGLAAGSSTTVTFTWKPEEAGDYTLKATVDPENLIQEKDETNNAATSVVTVAAPPVPWYIQWWPLIALVIIIIVALAAYMVIKKRAK